MDNIIISQQTPEKKIKKQNIKKDFSIIEDNYNDFILRQRYELYKNVWISVNNIKETTNLPIRQQNPPEDITENIVKVIIRNYEGDISCKWAKAIGLNGDLYSDKYTIDAPIEVKAFTSDGPSSFGPKKKFGVIYFLDMRHWIENKLTLWKVDVNNESTEWKQMKMNKTQTNEEQCDEKRRPHISWDKIYEQLHDKCIKIYENR